MINPNEILLEGLNITCDHIDKSKELLACKDTFCTPFGLYPIAIAMQEKGIESARSYNTFIGFLGEPYKIIDYSENLIKWHSNFVDNWKSYPITIKLIDNVIDII